MPRSGTADAHQHDHGRVLMGSGRVHPQRGVALTQGGGQVLRPADAGSPARGFAARCRRTAIGRGVPIPDAGDRCRPRPASWRCRSHRAVPADHHQRVIPGLHDPGGSRLAVPVTQTGRLVDQMGGRQLRPRRARSASPTTSRSAAASCPSSPAQIDASAECTAMTSAAVRTPSNAASNRSGLRWRIRDQYTTAAHSVPTCTQSGDRWITRIPKDKLVPAGQVEPSGSCQFHSVDHPGRQGAAPVTRPCRVVHITAGLCTTAGEVSKALAARRGPGGG